MHPLPGGDPRSPVDLRADRQGAGERGGFGRTETPGAPDEPCVPVRPGSGGGLVARTEPRARAESRRFVLEMLLRRYTDAGYAAGDQDDTEFQHWVRRYGARPPEGVQPAASYAVNSDPNPFVWVDLNKCIL